MLATRGSRSEVAARLATVVGVGVVALAAGWIATRSLQQDFAAYATAASAMARGLDPYVNQLGTPGGPWDGVAIYRHSRFLYSPLFAFLMQPLAALPYQVAKSIFTGLSVVALYAGVAIAGAGKPRHAAAERAPAPIEPADRAPPPASPSQEGSAAPTLPGARGRERNRTQTALGVFRALLPVLWLPVLVALERGQTDLLAFPLLAAAWRFRRRALGAGLLLALAMMLKPLVIGVLPLLVAARHRRWAAGTVAALIVLAGVNLLVAGRAVSTEYLRDVVPRAALYGEGGPDELLLDDAVLAPVSADLAAGVARVDGRGRAYAQEIGGFRRSASLPRLLADRDNVSTALAVATLAVLTVVLARGARRAPDEAAWFWAGLVAAVLASPVSWAMSLVWALPVLSRALDDAAGDDGTRASHVAATATAVLIGATVAAAGLALMAAAPGWIVAGVGTMALALRATARRRSTA